MQTNAAEELELELPEEEVENNAADISDDVQEEVANEERADAETRVRQFLESDDELKAYGDGVQKRIDKLTYKYREAERREQAALEYAKAVQMELENSPPK